MKSKIIGYVVLENKPASAPLCLSTQDTKPGQGILVRGGYFELFPTKRLALLAQVRTKRYSDAHRYGWDVGCIYPVRSAPAGAGRKE